MSLFGLFEDAPPSVRKPIFELDFGGSSDAWSVSLIALSLEASLGGAVDVLRAVFARNSAEPPEPAIGDSGSLSLGFEDDGLQLVFTGKVSGLRKALDGTTTVEICNGGADLARLRGNWSYANQSAGDLVKDLSAQAGVDTAEVEDGVNLAFMALHDGCTAYEHIAHLAQLSNYLTYFDAEGKLYFGPSEPGEAVAEFTYGVDILSLESFEIEPVQAGSQSFGEGAAGAEGKDAWCWLAKDPGAVSSKSGEEPLAPLSDGALRETKALELAAESAVWHSQLTRYNVRAQVPGVAAALPGKAIDLKGLDDDDANGSYLVRAVTHRLAKGRGFTSSLLLGKLDGGGLSLLGGLL